MRLILVGILLLEGLRNQISETVCEAFSRSRECSKDLRYISLCHLLPCDPGSTCRLGGFSGFFRTFSRVAIQAEAKIDFVPWAPTWWAIT
jgi:hypothetical protein